jgi:hypothetical protein
MREREWRLSQLGYGKESMSDGWSWTGAGKLCRALLGQFFRVRRAYEAKPCVIVCSRQFRLGAKLGAQ